MAAAQAVASARRRAGSGGLPELLTPGGSGAGGSLLGGRAASISEGPVSMPSPRRPLPEQLDNTELLFLKNVVLKFLDAQIKWVGWEGVG